MRPVPTGVERGPRRLGQPGCAHGAGRVSPSTSLEIEATAAGRDKLECSERRAAPGWAPPLSTSEGPWRSPPAATPTWHRRERACQWRGELEGAAAPAGRSGGPCIGAAGGPRIRPGIVGSSSHLGPRPPVTGDYSAARGSPSPPGPRPVGHLPPCPGFRSGFRSGLLLGRSLGP